MDDETGNESIEVRFPIRRVRDKLEINVIARLTWYHGRKENWICAKTSKSNSKWKQKKIGGESFEEGLLELGKKPFHRRFSQDSDGLDVEYMLGFDRNIQELVLMILPDQEFAKMA